MIENSSTTEIEQEINPAAYAAILLKYWWIIGPLTVVGGALGLLLAYNTPPKYRASCRFEIVEKEQLKLDQMSLEDRIQKMKDPLGRHIVLIKSAKLNKNVHKKVLSQYPDLKNIKKQLFTLKVNNVKGAERVMLDIAVESYDKGAAKMYLSELMQGYNELRMEEINMATSSTRDALAKEEAVLDKKISTMQQRIRDFKTKNNYVFFSTKSDYDKQYIAELFAKSNQLQMEIDAVAPLMKQLQDNTEHQQKILPRLIDTLSKTAVSNSILTDISEWKSRDIQLASLKATQDIMLETYKPAHPKMKAIQDQVKIISVEKSGYSENILNAAGARYTAMQDEKQSYIDKALEIETSFNNSAQLTTELEALNHQLTSLDNLKSTVHQKLVTISGTLNDTYTTRMIREPSAPSEPISPDHSKYTAVGAIAFGGSAVAVILVLFLIKSKRYNFSKIIREHDLPVLSVIPHFPPEK